MVTCLRESVDPKFMGDKFRTPEMQRVYLESYVKETLTNPMFGGRQTSSAYARFRGCECLDVSSENDKGPATWAPAKAGAAQSGS